MAVQNERAFQVELGLFFRNSGCDVVFEKRCQVGKHHLQTKPQKRDIDLLVSFKSESVAMELKVPLAGRVPETMFDFYADVSFLEAVVSNGVATSAVALLLTNDHSFWSGRDNSGVYSHLRNGKELYGRIEKPTGSKNTSIFVSSRYYCNWRNLKDQKLLKGGRYVLLDILS